VILIAVATTFAVVRLQRTSLLEVDELRLDAWHYRIGTTQPPSVHIDQSL